MLLVPVAVHEITMAAPDIICVEVRDPPPTRMPLVTLGSADAGAYHTWLSRTNPHTSATDLAFVVGPEKKHLRFQDARATEYLDRDAADVAGDYSITGGYTVEAVYRKSIPYDQAFSAGNQAAGAMARIGAVSMQHFLFLHLDANLSEGSYTIDYPAGTGLANSDFTFDAKTTRCSSIRATQVGHRRDDAVKLAYLAVWIPGAVTEGQIEFATTYGLSTFRIIDANGVSHFTGSIALRLGPTTNEPAGDGAGSGVRYVSTTTAPIAISAISKANPGVLTSTAHGLSNGDIVRLRGIAGMTQLEGQLVKVTNKADDTFELYTTADAAIDTSAFGTFTSGIYVSRYENKIHKTHVANRAGTYVYGLDYSAWVPSRFGLYRIHIPGLGVSDEFRIDDAVWHTVASYVSKGAYHQRSGLALDGRFGYTRPAAMKNGATPSPTIVKSKLPAAFWNEINVIGSGGFTSAQGAAAPWITATAIDAWGAWMDAGDWDVYLTTHGRGVYDLLDAYHLLSDSARNTNFNIPKSSAVLDSATYSSIDDMGDVLHHAIWGLDWYRRLQNPDGSVPGGLQGASQGTSHFDPSYLAFAQWYAFAPDHATTFMFAGLAAKLAKILEEEGKTTLATTWETAAVAAWNFAEDLYQNKASRDTFYADAVTAAGWDDATFQAKMNTMNANASGVQLLYRLFAGACLFRLTGETAYGDAFTSAWDNNSSIGMKGHAAWEYLRATGGDATTKSQITSQINGMALTLAQNYSEASNVAYRNLQFPSGSMTFGGCGTFLQYADPLIRADILAQEGTPTTRWRKVLQAGLCFLTGANQYGISTCRGLGARWPTCQLHDDSWCMGIDPPDGMTVYGWELQGGTLATSLNWNTGDLSYLIDVPAIARAANFEHARAVEPSRWAYPIWDVFWQNRYIVATMEGTVPQTLMPYLRAALYLHSWDGNTSRNNSPRKFGARF